MKSELRLQNCFGCKSYFTQNVLYWNESA